MAKLRLNLGIALCLTTASVCFGELQYASAGGYITITGDDAGESHLRIPATIDGLPVKVIAKGAFEMRDDLMQLELPTGLETIERGAFAGCMSLSSVSVPEGVKSIGDYAFNNCLNLVDITLPDTLTSIGEGTFGLTRIQNITIPVNVVKIGICPFSTCKDLKTISVANGNDSYAVHDGLLIGKEQRIVVQCIPSRNARVVIPKGVETIGAYAFCGCSDLRSVKMPDTVITIEKSAFACSGIKEIRCSRSLKIIGVDAFRGCSQLEYVLLNAGLEKIGENAFAACSKLKAVRVPSSIRDIGLGAFPYNAQYPKK